MSEEYANYEASLKHYRDLKNVVDTARDEGKIEGKIEGLEEGEVKGEKKKAIKAAIICKKKGYPTKDISEITGLTEEEIDDL